MPEGGSSGRTRRSEGGRRASAYCGRLCGRGSPTPWDQAASRAPYPPCPRRGVAVRDARPARSATHQPPTGGRRVTRAYRADRRSRCGTLRTRADARPDDRGRRAGGNRPGPRIRRPRTAPCRYGPCLAGPCPAGPRLSGPRLGGPGPAGPGLAGPRLSGPGPGGPWSERGAHPVGRRRTPAGRPPSLPARTVLRPLDRTPEGGHLGLRPADPRRTPGPAVACHFRRSPDHHRTRCRCRGRHGPPLPSSARRAPPGSPSAGRSPLRVGRRPRADGRHPRAATACPIPRAVPGHRRAAVPGSPEPGRRRVGRHRQVGPQAIVGCRHLRSDGPAGALSPAWRPGRHRDQDDAKTRLQTTERTRGGTRRRPPRRGAFFRRNPATTYSPRGISPKYHRRWRA